MNIKPRVEDLVTLFLSQAIYSTVIGTNDFK
jgi:hypothetical protein